MTAYSQKWDLEVLFSGGSRSNEFDAFLTKLDSHVNQLQQELEKIHAEQGFQAEHLVELIHLFQMAQSELMESQSFVGCLGAQNVKDQAAKQLTGKVMQLGAAYQSKMTEFDEVLSNLQEDSWNQLLQHPDMKDIEFTLAERRMLAKEKLPAEQESLANDLAVDGYHAWSELYDTIVGQMSIRVEKDGEEQDLSVGQAFNLLSNPDPSIRSSVFAKWEEAWSQQAELCSSALNHLAGFRLALDRHRGWESPLHEPLLINRMSEATLSVMWEVIERNKDRLVRYLERKAKLLNRDRLSWEDVAAPIGSSHQKIPYDEGAAFIVEQFRKFSPKMADFSEKAFQEAWIEAEDRTGKRPGGFCTSFPIHNQTRIFMTYSGTSDNVSTLAHELGHAYHQYVMDDLPAFSQNYAMNVAETASTFAEMIVMDAAVKNAKNDQEKIALLDDKLQNSVAFFMNIHARFLFETEFYRRRREGLISVEQLNELMVESQKKAFCDQLSAYHPHFWASKLHFYITDVPFYNFPYTFGYLFSAGIYAQALKEGTQFEERYVDLLRDTGRMTVEELAQRHLGVDLTRPEFWQDAVNAATSDLEEFLRLTERM